MSQIGGSNPRGRIRQDSRDNPHKSSGDPTPEDARGLHHERQWTSNDWRQWDKDHGHVLWMGTLEEDWTDNTIAGFFLHYGSKVSITRKGRENYCFVSFDDADEAREFMARHNHQLLPGVSSDTRFNMRPRTRPRWYREGGERPHGGRSEGGYQRDSRGSGLDGRDDRRRLGNPGGKRGSHDSRLFNGPSPRLFGRNSGRGRGRQDRDGMPSSRDENMRGDGRQAAFRRIFKFGRKRSRSRSRSRSSRSRTSRSRSRSRSSSRSDSSQSSDSSSDSRSSRDGSHSRKRQSQGSPSAGSKDKISRASGRRVQQPDLKCDKQGGRGREVNEASQVGGQNDGRNEENRFTPASGNENIPGDNGAGQRRGNGTNDECQQPPDDVKGLVPMVCDGEGREGSEGDGQGSVARRDRVGQFAANDREGRNQGRDASLGDDAAGAGNESIQSPRESVPTIKNGVCHSAVASRRIEAGEGDDTRATPGDTAPRSSTRTDHLPDEDKGARENNSSMLASSPTPLPRTVEQGDTGRQYSEENERIAPEEIRSKWKHLLNQAAAFPANNVERCENPDKIDGQDEAGRDIPEVSTSYVPREEQHPRNEETDSKLSRSDEETRHDTTAISQDVEGYISSEDSGSSQEQNEIEGALSVRVGEGTGMKQLPPAGMGLPRGSLYGGENRQKTPFRSIDRNDLVNGFAAVAAAAARARLQGQNIEGGWSSQFVSPGGSPRACRVGSRAPPISNGAVLDGINGDATAHAELEHPRVNEKRARLQGSELGPSNGERNAMDVDDHERGVNGNGAEGTHVSDGENSKSRIDRSKTRLLEKFHEEVRQSESRTGLKRRASATLAQVIDHHMARRRVNGSCDRDAASSPQRRGSDCRNSSNNMYVKGGKSSPESSSDMSPITSAPLPDGSGVVAAAWAHGDVLPLSAEAATHMRLVAPLMAGEPEGRRVVLRTAAAIAAGVVELYMHEYRLEVTGVCRDGLLLELYSSGMRGRCGHKGSRENLSALSAVSKKFQSAFDRIVSLNLEIGMLRVPHVEALESVPPDSSSREMLEWRNDGTSTILHFEPASSDGEGRSASHVTNGKREVPSWHSEGPRLLGIHNDIGPLLPRTGLLESFNIDVFPVPPPPASETSAGVNQGHPLVISHLALILSDSEVFNGGGGGSVCGDAMRSNHSGVDVPKLSARLGCVPPTRTASGLTWRQVTGLTCVAAVNRLAYGPRLELERKIRLAEGLHSSQVEALASKVAEEDILLVILAGRQGASMEMIASRLSVELTIKGKNPAVVDTKTFMQQRAHPSHPTVIGRGRAPVVGSVPELRSCLQTLDSSSLRKAVAALLGQARARAGLLGMSNGGGGSSPSAGWHWSDVVIVHGSEALDVDLLPPRGFGLSNSEAISVFVDNIPQVCVDSLTPVDGHDVRLLRVLVAREISERKAGTAAATAVEFNHMSDIRGENGAVGIPFAPFGAAGFLNEWFLTEDIEEAQWRAFRASATVYVNTALPYDLHVLKPMAEPLLRSIKPPYSYPKGNRICSSSSHGGDGCRSPTYALARAVLRLLGSCEALHAPRLPMSSVLAGLTERNSWT